MDQLISPAAGIMLEIGATPVKQGVPIEAASRMQLTVGDAASQVWETIEQLVVFAYLQWYLEHFEFKLLTVNKK